MFVPDADQYPISTKKPENPTNPKKPNRSASISKPSHKKLKGHRLNGGLFLIWEFPDLAGLR